MRRPAEAVRGFLPFALFAVTALFFYWPALVGGEILLPLDNLWRMLPWKDSPGAVPHNLLISDMILQNYPWKVILEQAVQQRALPLWNPYVMGGLPYLGTGQTGVLYPFTVLFLLLGPLHAYAWYCALHQFLAGSLMYLFARRFGLGRVGSTVAGVVFAFSFFLTVSYVWPMVLGAAVWLPLGLWSLTGLARAAERRDFGRSLVVDLPAGALAIALSVLGGHLEITFYATFAIALYGVYLAARLLLTGQKGPAGRFFVATSLAISLGVLIAAVQLVPFLELLQANNRQGDTTYHQVISYALPARQVFGLIMPDFFGNPATHDYFDLTTGHREPIVKNALGESIDNPFWGIKNYVEAGGYVGVLPVVLAILGAILARHRDRWFFIGLAALSVLLAFGSPLYALIYYGMPFFSQLRTPFRWLYLFDVSVAALAGLGADRLVRQVDGVRTRLIAKWIPAALGLGGLAVLAASFGARGRSVEFADRYLARTPELQHAFASGAMLYSYEFRNLGIFFVLLAVGGILAALALRPEVAGGLCIGAVLSRSPGIENVRTLGPPSPWERILVKDVIGVLIVLTIVADLVYAGRPFASVTPASILSERYDLSIIPASPDGPRAVSYGDPEVLPANLGVLVGVPTIGGYDTIISSNFVRLWSLVEPPVDLPYNKIGRLHQASSLSSPILDLLGVRYVLTTSTLDNPGVRLMGTSGPIHIYERPTALPRAFVVGQALWVADDDAARAAIAAPDFQPGHSLVLIGPTMPADNGRGTAAIQDYSFGRVTIDAVIEGTAWLVLADSNAPGWRATVDDVTTPVITADGYVRAIHLTPGTHRVIFSYLPLSLEIGAYVTFLGAILVGLIATLPWWRRAIGHYAGQAERVFRNTTLPMVTSFLNKGIDFGFAALMLRVLGPSSVGEYTVAIILMGYFEIFTNFGLGTLIIREVARDRSRSGRFLANAVALRIALIAIASPVAAALVFFGHSWFGLGTPGIVAFALLTLSLIPSNLTAALSSLFNAWERLEIPATITVATTLARVTLGSAALLLGAGIVGLASVSLLLNVILVIVFVILVRRALRFHLVGPVPADLPAMLTQSYPLFLNHVLVTIFFKIDVLLLQAMKGSETVGYYATAYKWLDGFLIVPSTFTFAVFPALSRFAEQKGAGLRDAYDLSLRVLVSLAIPIAASVAFLSGDLILVLGGRAYYPESANALAILICFLPFSYVNGLTQYALVAVNRQRFITGAFFIASAFNLGANLIFIPRYGLYATSVVTVLSEIVLMVPFLIAVRGTIGWPNWLGVAGKPLLAGALLVLTVIAVSVEERHLALVVGLAVYVAVIWRLNVFSTNEIGVLRRLVRPPRTIATIP